MTAANRRIAAPICRIFCDVVVAVVNTRPVPPQCVRRDERS
jgi:hypothetical protein